jgi:hypothetical protein
MYRIIYEETNISHPEGPMVAIFVFTSPGKPKKIWELLGNEGEQAWMMNKAKDEINKI